MSFSSVIGFVSTNEYLSPFFEVLVHLAALMFFFLLAVKFFDEVKNGKSALERGKLRLEKEKLSLEIKKLQYEVLSLEKAHSDVKEVNILLLDSLTKNKSSFTDENTSILDIVLTKRLHKIGVLTLAIFLMVSLVSLFAVVSGEAPEPIGILVFLIISAIFLVPTVLRKQIRTDSPITIRRIIDLLAMTSALIFLGLMISILLLALVVHLLST